MKALALCLLVFAAEARADQVLKYEPEVVEVSGQITKGKEEHPNGTWFDFFLIKLDVPASIKGDDSGQTVNASETGVMEIHVFSKDAELRKKLSSMVGHKARLKGTLFHSHTAWHVRPLVMSVTEVKEAK